MFGHKFIKTRKIFVLVFFTLNILECFIGTHNKQTCGRWKCLIWRLICETVLMNIWIVLMFIIKLSMLFFMTNFWVCFILFLKKMLLQKYFLAFSFNILCFNRLRCLLNTAKLSLKTM